MVQLEKFLTKRLGRRGPQTDRNAEVPIRAADGAGETQGASSREGMRRRAPPSYCQDGEGVGPRRPGVEQGRPRGRRRPAAWMGRGAGPVSNREGERGEYSPSDVRRGTPFRRDEGEA